MKSRKLSLWALVGVAGVFCLSLTLNADPAPEPKQADERLSVDEARRHARVMHRIYAATLEVMHHRYFHNNRAVLPARALEDVFKELDEEAKIQTGWIAVNTPAMSVEHQAKTPFEKDAAAALAAGKTEYERVEEGYYRHAGQIPLGSGCVSCHTRLSQRADGKPRFAGLVISIPVKER